MEPNTWRMVKAEIKFGVGADAPNSCMTVGLYIAHYSRTVLLQKRHGKSRALDHFS